MRLVPLLLLLWPVALFGSDPDTSKTGLQQYTPGNTRILLSYWNDDFIFWSEVNRIFKRTVFSKSDDLLTTNFLSQFDYQLDEQNAISLDIFLNIITFRETQQRTDMISFRFDYKKIFPDLILRFGAGYSTTGVFGGEQIQNWYHRLTGVKEVDVQYIEDRFSTLHFLVDGRYNLYNYKSLNLSPILLSSFSSRAFSSFLESGLCLNNYYFSTGGLQQYLFEIQAGYIRYFNIREEFRQLYSSNFFAGAMITRSVYKNFSAALFVFHNEYGAKNQNHFGLMFMINSKTVKPVSLNNLKFP